MRRQTAGVEVETTEGVLVFVFMGRVYYPSSYDGLCLLI
jgi:hypothetical protein